MSTGIPDLNKGAPAAAPVAASDERQPSQLKGHVQYVGGVVEETIGQALNATGWKASGEANKAAAVDEMRAAKEQSERATGGAGARAAGMADPRLAHAEGRSEGVLGRTLGCAGMEEDGNTKQRVARERAADGSL